MRKSRELKTVVNNIVIYTENLLRGDSMCSYHLYQKKSWCVAIGVLICLTIARISGCIRASKQHVAYLKKRIAKPYQGRSKFNFNFLPW